MDNTHKFVEKLHDKQAKEAANKRRNGNGNPEGRLSSKRHGTQK